MPNLKEQIEALKALGLARKEILEVLIARDIAESNRQLMTRMSLDRATATLQTVLSYCLRGYTWDQIGELINDADRITARDEKGRVDFIELVRTVLRYAETWQAANKAMGGKNGQ